MKSLILVIGKPHLFLTSPRFKPLKSNFLSGLSGPSSGEKVSDLGQQRLLPDNQTKASSTDENQVEYGKRFLPPEWVDLQEDIEARLNEV